jgi:crotonobetainyl-CoA:carnitine CoA-transferase CaiB-like acyl-CoA transferase
MASFMLVEHANGALFDPPTGPAIYRRTVEPNRRPYRTRDGHIAVLIYNDKQWDAFVADVRPGWGADPRFATLAARSRAIDAVYARIAAIMVERSTAEWLATFHRLDIPAAALHAPGQLFDDPHLAAAGFFETVETRHGTVRFPGVPTWLGRTPGRVAAGAPELGEHTEAILAELAARRRIAPADVE